MANSLTYRELLFCKYYLADPKLNQTKAAISAGYAKASASSMATGLMKKPLIVGYIARQMEKRCERIEIDHDWVLSELLRHYKTDLGKFLNIDHAGQAVVDFSQCTPSDLSVIDSITVEERKDPATGELVIKTKIKLPNKLDLLKTMGKHVNVQAFKDKIEHAVAIELNFDKQDEDA